MNFFQYNNGESITNGAFRISASQLSRFFDDTSNWYREFLLGEGGFLGSTATELGNCIHAAAAMHHTLKSIDHQQIHAYIDSLTSPDIDINLIRDQLDPMLGAFLPFLRSTRVTASEQFLYKEILPGIGVGGSCDAFDSHTGTIFDYKTTSQKTQITSFSRAYWFQLMTYAWLYKQLGHQVNYIKLVYITRNETGRFSEKTGKPLQDYPSQVYTVQEPVTQANLDLIESCIKLIAEYVQCWQQHPELRHILAQDYRLKELPKPKLFKD